MAVMRNGATDSLTHLDLSQYAANQRDRNFNLA
jgi:hypothetical protein